MKKIVSALLVCVLVVGMLFALTSCGKTLSGKYKENFTGNVIYEFDMFGNVTKTVDNLFGDDTVTDGKYEINEEGDKITFTFGDDSYELPLAVYDSYIEMGLSKYNKVD